MNLARVQKFSFKVLIIAHWLAGGMAASAKTQVIRVLNAAVFVDQRNISGDLQRPCIAYQCFVGYFQQSGSAVGFLAVLEPAVKRLGRRGQIFLALSVSRLDLFRRIIHVCNKCICGLGAVWCRILIDSDSGGRRGLGSVIHDFFLQEILFPHIL